MILMGENFIHESAEVSDQASIGAGTKIWHQVHIREGARIGENCVLSKNVYIDHDVSIGNNVKLQNNVSVYNGVTLEDDVFVGPSVVFTNDLCPRSKDWSPDKRVETLVRKGASIGANATIICGITIGEHAMIGAGSVVTKDVPPHALVLGNPAKIVGHMCECGSKIDKNNKCTKCGKVLELE